MGVDWAVVVPELAREHPRDSRSPEQTYRAWGFAEGGAVQLPVGYLRAINDTTVSLTTSQLADCALGHRHYVVHDDGTVVVNAHILLQTRGPVPLDNAYRILKDLASPELQECIEDEATRVSRVIVRAEAARQGTETVVAGESRVRVLGFHRLFEVDADPSSASDFEPLLRLPEHPGLKDTCPSRQAHCFVGNGNFLFVTRDDNSRIEYSPRSVIESYEYTYASLMRFDRVLLETLQATTPMTRTPTASNDRDIRAAIERIEQLGDKVSLFLFRLDDVVASFTPSDLAYWGELLRLWRVREITQSAAQSSRCFRISSSDLEPS